MSALSIVEPLDVIKHVRSSLVPSGVYFSIGALDFQGREKAFHGSIIPAIATAAHAAGDAVRRE